MYGIQTNLQKHGSSRFITVTSLHVGKFSSTLSPVYVTIRSVFIGLSFLLVSNQSPLLSKFLITQTPLSCPSPLIRTTTLHCSGESCSSESSRRLLPVTNPPDLLGGSGWGRRFSYRLTAPQIAFIGARYIASLLCCCDITGI